MKTYPQMAIQTIYPETLSCKFLHNCLKFSLVLVFLQLLQLDSIYAQSPKTKKQAFPPNAEADAFIEKNKAPFGGKIAVVAMRDSHLLYQYSLGEFTVNTQENIGAMSSWFTAALVMQFVDQGKIKLDDKVSKYIPIFKQYAKGYITLRHCLTHTTGIEADKGGVQKVFQKSKFASLEEQVNSFASKHEIQTNPGEEFYYSNIGLNIAARVLEIVAKKSFDRLVTERIFRPLGMKKSSFASEVGVDPTAGAISTAADYARFLLMLLNKGTLNGKPVLSEDAVKELLAIQSIDVKKSYVPAAASQMELTFGSWIDTNSNAQPKIYVSPGFFGSYAYMDLDKKLTVVIVTRPASKEVKGEILKIVDLLN